jgi:hypothetical protein
VLSERGLAVALEALALRAPVPVKLEAALDRRLPEQVEAAVYYVVAEGLANIHKHAGATRVVVRVASDETRLVVEVVDDGIGGADDEGKRPARVVRPRRGAQRRPCAGQLAGGRHAAACGTSHPVGRRMGEQSPPILRKVGGLRAVERRARRGVDARSVDVSELSAGVSEGTSAGGEDVTAGESAGGADESG